MKHFQVIKPVPVFEHLPWNVIDRIAGFADTETNLALRSSAQAIKEVVDRAASRLERLLIQMDCRSFATTITLKSGSKTSKFHRQVIVKPCRKGYRLSNPKQQWKGKVQAKPLHEGVVGTIMKVLKNPRVSIGKLTIDFSADTLKPRMSKFDLETFQQLKMSILDLLRSGLEQRRQKLQVGTLVMKLSDGNEADLLCILPNLKPRTLRSIELDFGDNKEISLDRIIAMDQWKKGTKLVANGFFMDSVPFEAWKHFQCLMVSMKKLDVGTFKIMTKHYSVHPTLTYAWIKCTGARETVDGYNQQRVEEEQNWANSVWADSGNIVLVDDTNIIFREAFQ